MPFFRLVADLRREVEGLDQRCERQALHDERDHDHTHRDQDDLCAVRKWGAVAERQWQRERGSERHDTSHPRPCHERDSLGIWHRLATADRGAEMARHKSRHGHPEQSQHDRDQAQRCTRDQHGRERLRRNLRYDRADFEAENEEDERVEDEDDEIPHSARLES